MRLIPPIKPYSNRFIKGFICMFVYVACWPLLAYFAGNLIPAIGSGDLSKVSNIIIKSGSVKVNGVVETRRGRKLNRGDKVMFLKNELIFE